jgi:hypothetical protein
MNDDKTIIDDDKTIYTIFDEYKENTTITLDKFTADTLQKHLPDVHAWVQATYSRVAQIKPGLGRRQKGDCVRGLSMREAVKYLETSGFLNDF